MSAEHKVIEKKIVPDNIYQIRAAVSTWIADDNINVVISTGGTGVTGRDGTPEAIEPLLDKVLDGFGEVFRMLSYQDIKTSTIQSRALAGVANGTYVFCLPGSSSACRTGWDLLIKDQLDHRTQPCNLAQLMPRLLEK
jgi:molybdenum cofactor biosynthesis protein B